MLLFLAVMLVFRSAVADWNPVPSGSMQPSILVGDRIVVDKLAYGLRLPFTLTRLATWRAPERGDVVTFTSPEDGRLLVKRVVAVPGDRVSLQHDHLTINGVAASYQPLPDDQAPFKPPPGYRLYQERVLGSTRFIMLHDGPPAGFVSSFADVVVPQGKYMVLGDNRDNSRDYRYIGFVPQRNIIGQAKAVAFSLDYDHYYAPRFGRFLTELR